MIKYTIIIISLLWQVSACLAQNFTFSKGQQDYVKYKNQGNPLHAFEKGQKIKFPYDFFIDGFGSIDSMIVSSGVVLYSNAKPDGVINITAHNFGGEQGIESDYEICYQINKVLNGDSIYILEFEFKHTGYPNLTEYQIVLNKTKQHIQFNYGNTAYPQSDSSKTLCLFVVSKDSISSPIVRIVGKDPNNPTISTSFAEFNYLDAPPSPNSYYRFSNLSTAIGDLSLKQDLLIEPSENGIRVSLGNRFINGSVYDLNGKLLSTGKSHGTKSLFFDGIKELKSPYILHFQDLHTTQSLTVKIQP